MRPAPENGSGFAARPLRIVILGLSITSSWGNGHATTYRGLMRALCRRGHEVLFLECDKPWYRAHRDLRDPPFGRVRLYEGLAELRRRWAGEIRNADLVIVGSYVPDGIAVARWAQAVATGIVAFYDIDTPVTLAALAAGTCPYLDAALVPRFDLYLSFTGGPALRLVEAHYRAPAARALYCGVDPERHRPCTDGSTRWDLGYLGTYSADRQPLLDALLCNPARRWNKGRFAVAGPLYPAELRWPANVERIEHVGPDEHPRYYGRQRFTLNITRADMVRLGYSPSVRLFEAAACGVPIVSDWWPGLATIFEPGREILIARNSGDVLHFLREMAEPERARIAEAARARVLATHTAEHRAVELEGYIAEVAAAPPAPTPALEAAGSAELPR
ncbi:MAG: glycosyltransferase [Alphaproteobacteria bacterium]